MNTDVVAINVVGSNFYRGRIKTEPDAPFQFPLKVIRSPTMSQEQELESRALAMFPQHVGLAESFRRCL